MASDKITLHMLPRAYTCPNPSPYPIKLETFLRITGLEYEVDFNKAIGPKGKTPWITLSGKDYADSQLILEYLSDRFDNDINAHLSTEDKALCRVFRVMMEERYYWCGALDRYQHNAGKHNEHFFPPVKPGIPGFIDKLIKKRVASRFIKNGKLHGIGRHDMETMRNFGKGDIRAVSELLGGNKYFFNGPSPCELDLVVFAFVTIMLHCTPDDNVYRLLVEEECTNLKEHYLNMKVTYWPDWEECKTEKP